MFRFMNKQQYKIHPALEINSSSAPIFITCLSKTTEKNMEVEKYSYFHLASERLVYSGENKSDF